MLEYFSFTDLLEKIVDNRGRTAPTSETGVPLIATNCIGPGNLFPTFEKIRYVSQATYETWFRGHPEPGDILFVTKGSPGRTALVPDPVPFCIAQDMVALRADARKVYPPYLFALLRSPETLAKIEGLHVGTMIPHFKKGNFNQLKLPVPTRKQQELIGDTYMDFSRTIELNRQMNRTLDEIACTLFRSWFVNFDPVRAKMEGRQPEAMDAATAALFPNRLVDSELGLIPEGWEVGNLGQIIELHDSKRIPLSSAQRAKRPGLYPYYGATSIMNYVDDYLFDGVYVLVGEDGSVMNDDQSPIVQYVWGKFWVNNHAHVLTPREGLSVDHLVLILRNVRIAPFVTGAVQAKVSQGNLKKVPVVKASHEINAQFASLLDPLFAMIRANSEEVQTLSELRDTLLPELMSGQLVSSGSDSTV